MPLPLNLTPLDTTLLNEVFLKPLSAHQVGIIRKVAKLFVFSFCFALCPLVLFAIGWLIRILLQCDTGISSHSCEDQPELRRTLILIFHLSMNALLITIPAGFMLFALSIVTLGMSRRSLIFWINAIFLAPTILGFIIYIINFITLGF